MNTTEENLAKLMQKYEINITHLKMLKTLENYKIVMILDDSSSMLQIDPNKKISRWKELENFVKIVIELSAVFNSNGCDVHFLNMNAVKNVRNFDKLKIFFNGDPGGCTPITKEIKKVIKDNPPELLSSKNLLVIIATDGEPTNESGMK